MLRRREKGTNPLAYGRGKWVFLSPSLPQVSVVKSQYSKNSQIYVDPSNVTKTPLYLSELLCLSTSWGEQDTTTSLPAVTSLRMACLSVRAPRAKSTMQNCNHVTFKTELSDPKSH